jgi:TolB protein
MLVRVFRLSDKFGITFLKVSAWLGQQVLGYAAIPTGRVWAFVAGVLGRFAAVGRAAQARAAARAAQAPTDQLRAQVRALSAFSVMVLGALMAFVLWSTSAGSALGGGTSLGQLPPLATRVPPATLMPTPLPTPTVVPDPLRVGGSIAYTLRTNGQDDIYALAIGQAYPLQLTNDPADDRDPAWSPDGVYLAFASHRDGNWELYALDTITGETIRLTDDPDFQGAPSWSPDGQWIVYESYKGQNLDLYILKLDGTEGPYRLTYNPAPDFEPAWSPDGRHIAYTSWRDDNQEIYVLSLDNPSEQDAVNLTRTADLDEDHPAWAPNGLHVAYSAPNENGLEIVYARPYNDPEAEPLIIGQGRQPTWAPNGASLVFASGPAGWQRAYLVAGQFGTFGVASAVSEFPGRMSDPDWSGAATAEQLFSWGGVQADAVPLYEEDIAYEQPEAPRYRLVFLNEVEAPQAYLSDRVDASFDALRAATLAQTGFDFLGTLSDAWWALDRQPEPGEERQNWHYAGRALAVNRNLILGYPAPLEVVREDIGIQTYWHLFVRAEAQNGLLGEPLRRKPWDFLARTSGDLRAYNQGGALKDAIPPGYYIDFTQLAADYGWERVPADNSWLRNYSGVRFWEFVNTQSLTWVEAMLEIYPRQDLNAFVGVPASASEGEGS